MPVGLLQSELTTRRLPFLVHRHVAEQREHVIFSLNPEARFLLHSFPSPYTLDKRAQSIS